MNHSDAHQLPLGAGSCRTAPSCTERRPRSCPRWSAPCARPSCAAAATRACSGGATSSSCVLAPSPCPLLPPNSSALAHGGGSIGQPVSESVPSVFTLTREVLVIPDIRKAPRWGSCAACHGEVARDVGAEELTFLPDLWVLRSQEGVSKGQGSGKLRLAVCAHSGTSCSRACRWGTRPGRRSARACACAAPARARTTAWMSLPSSPLTAAPARNMQCPVRCCRGSA